MGTAILSLFCARHGSVWRNPDIHEVALKENADLSDSPFTGVISLNPSLNVYITLQQFMSNVHHGLDGWDTRRSRSQITNSLGAQNQLVDLSQHFSQQEHKSQIILGIIQLINVIQNPSGSFYITCSPVVP